MEAWLSWCPSILREHCLKRSCLVIVVFNEVFFIMQLQDDCSGLFFVHPVFKIPKTYLKNQFAVLLHIILYFNVIHFITYNTLNTLSTCLNLSFYNLYLSASNLQQQIST